VVNPLIVPGRRWAEHRPAARVPLDRDAAM